MIRIWRPTSAPCPNRRSRRSSFVERLARSRRMSGPRVTVFAHQDLIEAERAALERDRRAGHVQAPGPVGAFTGQGAGLVRPRAEPLDPLPARAGVVQAQPLDVHDLPARPLHLGERLAEAGQVAIREDVTVEELGLARALPVEVMDDPVVEVEAAILQAGAHASEEGWRPLPQPRD